jgi:hypothetical protein
MRDLQINSKRSMNFFLEFSDITKRLVWPDIKTKRNKIKGICIRMCFVKRPSQIKSAGLRPLKIYDNFLKRK